MSNSPQPGKPDQGKRDQDLEHQIEERWRNGDPDWLAIGQGLAELINELCPQKKMRATVAGRVRKHLKWLDKRRKWDKAKPLMAYITAAIKDCLKDPPRWEDLVTQAEHTVGRYVWRDQDRAAVMSQAVGDLFLAFDDARVLDPDRLLRFLSKVLQRRAVDHFRNSSRYSQLKQEAVSAPSDVDDDFDQGDEVIETSSLSSEQLQSDEDYQWSPEISAAMEDERFKELGIVASKAYDDADQAPAPGIKESEREGQRAASDASYKKPGRNQELARQINRHRARNRYRADEQKANVGQKSQQLVPHKPIDGANLQGRASEAASNGRPQSYDAPSLTHDESLKEKTIEEIVADKKRAQTRMDNNVRERVRQRAENSKTRKPLCECVAPGCSGHLPGERCSEPLPEDFSYVNIYSDPHSPRLLTNLQAMCARCALRFDSWNKLAQLFKSKSKLGAPMFSAEAWQEVEDSVFRAANSERLADAVLADFFKRKLEWHMTGSLRDFILGEAVQRRSRLQRLAELYFENQYFKKELEAQLTEQDLRNNETLVLFTQFFRRFEGFFIGKLRILMNKANPVIPSDFERPDPKLIDGCLLHPVIIVEIRCDCLGQGTYVRAELSRSDRQRLEDEGVVCQCGSKRKEYRIVDKNCRSSREALPFYQAVTGDFAEGNNNSEQKGNKTAKEAARTQLILMYLRGAHKQSKNRGRAEAVSVSGSHRT
jgi:hypothetical protein